MNSENDRKTVIKTLQTLAQGVLELKNATRQKRPVIIEFSGSPKSGKTSCINSLELFFKRNGFSVEIVQERASICPVANKQSPMFNLWTACSTLCAVIATLECKETICDVLILDRGIFDAMCWFNWLHEQKYLNDDYKKIISDFFLHDEFTKKIDMVFAFVVTPECSIAREFAHLLTDKEGTIMNERVLSGYKNSISSTEKEYARFFHNIIIVDTTEKRQNEVSKLVTEKTLNLLKDKMMERIGYLDNNEEIQNLFQNSVTISFDEINSLNLKLHYDLRQKVEDETNFIQPIPIAIIVGNDKKEIFVVKKNKKSTSKESPEKDKELIYVGGHIRKEDVLNDDDDFLKICKSALKREFKEELGIEYSFDNLRPHLIYSDHQQRSRQHLAVCFVINVNTSAFKYRVNTDELVAKTASNRSGKFVDIKSLEKGKMEHWGCHILKDILHIDIEEEKNLWNI